MRDINRPQDEQLTQEQVDHLTNQIRIAFRSIDSHLKNWGFKFSDGEMPEIECLASIKGDKGQGLRESIRYNPADLNQQEALISLFLRMKEKSENDRNSFSGMALSLHFRAHNIQITTLRLNQNFFDKKAADAMRSSQIPHRLETETSRAGAVIREHIEHCLKPSIDIDEKAQTAIGVPRPLSGKPKVAPKQVETPQPNLNAYLRQVAPNIVAEVSARNSERGDLAETVRLITFDRQKTTPQLDQQIELEDLNPIEKNLLKSILHFSNIRTALDLQKFIYDNNLSNAKEDWTNVVSLMEKACRAKRVDLVMTSRVARKLLEHLQYLGIIQE